MYICALLLICSNYFSEVSGQQLVGSGNDTTKILKLLHVIFRHGNRTPTSTYPNDPYINQRYFPYGLGQITNEGKQLLFTIGEWLKQRYGYFLGDLYVPDAVRVQSTDYTRTRMSAASLLAGLFPPTDTSNRWNIRLNWQPIPIFAEPLNEDALLELRLPCPRYDEVYDEIFNMTEVQSYLVANEPLFEELTNITGMPILVPEDIQFLYGTLRAESDFGLKLPKWTEKYYPHRLLPLNEISFIYGAYTEEAKRLLIGPFIKKMINKWKQKRDGTIMPKDRKIFLYSGHDATVVSILLALNIWKPQLADYGITTIFELLQDTNCGTYGIQIYLRNSPESDAVPLTIPGCDHFCPLNKFIELIKNVIPKNETAECEAMGNTNLSTQVAVRRCLKPKNVA